MSREAEVRDQYNRLLMQRDDINAQIRKVYEELEGLSSAASLNFIKESVGKVLIKKESYQPTCYIQVIKVEDEEVTFRDLRYLMEDPEEDHYTALEDYRLLTKEEADELVTIFMEHPLYSYTKSLSSCCSK